MADAKTKTVNYTVEMVERMVAMYEQLGNEGIEQIAETVGRPVRSVRSKLVREGVYIAAPTKVKAKREDGPTKKDLLNELESLVSFDVGGLMGATKEAIAAVIALAQPEADEAETAEQPEVAQQD